MDDRDRNQFVDELLDATLARYRGAEPRLGLEERVLTRLRSEQQPQPWLGWTWRLAAGVVVFAIVLATAHWARRMVFAPGTPARISGSSPTEPSKSATSASILQPDATKPVASHTARRIKSRSMRQVALRRVMAEPRQDIFPSPAPLSKEERLLLSYMKLGPPPASMGLHKGSEEIEEIQIPPLEIAPLKSESVQLENEIN
jgi:hypothetical protein